jgi:hypothetical protein
LLIQCICSCSLCVEVYKHWRLRVLNKGKMGVLFWQGYFDALRIEKMTSNITVTLLCPGPVFSNFLAESFTDKLGEVSWWLQLPKFCQSSVVPTPKSQLKAGS